MKSIFISLLALLPFYSVISQVQINDCADALVVCTNENLDFNPIGPGFDDYADPDNDEGCIVALEQNSAWYYFEINPNAPPDLVLGFIIHPNGGLGEDYDWALYGPDVTCGALGSPIRCSSSSAACDFCPETGMGMGTTDFTEGPGTGDGFVATLVVQPGQGFYLMIDNWLGTTNGFVLEWTDSAAEYLNCEAEPPCALEALAGPDIMACEGDTEVQLNGGSNGNHDNEMYLWSGSFLDDPTLQFPTVTIPPGFTGTLTYSLTVTEDTCVSEDQMDLIVNPLPVVMINQIGPFCPNSPPQVLTATPPGGIWGGDATGFIFSPSFNGPGIHTVTYTYTDANGCTTVESMDILVHDGPEVSVDPNPAEFCESENTILLTATGDGGNGAYTFNWTTPAGTAQGETYIASLAGLYTVTVTDANGCTHSSTTTVIIHENPDVEINDPGPICASIQFFTLTATPPGGFFDGTIISETGDILPNETAPGTYQISYTYVDEHECMSTEYIDITIIPVPAALPASNSPVCSGQQILLTGETDGTGSLVSYLWTGPNGYTSNVQNPTNATDPGEYVLQVTIDDCPSELSSVTVVVIDLPEATATNGGPYCNGESIQLFGSVNESGNVITYSWTGPNGYTSDVQNPLNATIAGIYTLIVSVDGCVSAPVSTEVIFGAAPDAMATNSGPYCQGETVSLFGSTMSGGTTITYQWTGPNGYVSTVQNPTDASESGVYQLIVNVDGCLSAMAATTVTVYPSPQPMISGQDAFCTGFSSTMDAGAGYSSYLWDNGNTNQTREVFASGTYSVTVSDINGCTGVDSFTVTENASLLPVITGTLSFCEGSGTVLDAGPGFLTYTWSTGETSQSIVVDDGGNVGVVVSDAAGCTGSAIVTTVEHPNPNVTIGGSTTYCIGGYTILDAGAFASYQWSNDSTTQTILVSNPGVYSVSVIDNNGCTGSASASINESTSLNPVITGNLAFCENGSTTLNAGSGFATYLWSDGSMNQTLLVTVAGSYSVSVSDGQGCSGDTTVSVSEVLPPVAVLQSGSTLCNTLAGGSIIDLYDLILSGDLNGNWQDLDNSGAVGLFTNLNFASVPAGDYRFLYTTNSAIDPCPEAIYQVVITVMDCACPDVFFFNADPLCNAGDMLDLSTLENTSESGVWSLVQTPGGSNPATLNGSLFNPTASDTGTYVLQFTLLNQPPPGCPSDFTVTVEVGASVDAGIALQPLAFCDGDDQVVSLANLITGEDANGTWTETSITPSQGSAFNPVSGTFNTDNQIPGTYTFVYALASQGACPDDATEVLVVINAVPVAVAVDQVEIDCANLTQTLDASGSSSGPAYTIVWTGPGLVQDGNENTLTPTIDQAGNYVLTITHIQTGCSSTASVTVTANTDPPTDALIDSDDPDCFGDQNGFIHISQVIGGEAPYVYSLNQSSYTPNANYNNLSAGNYNLEVEDANGCRWDTTIILTEPGVITLDIGPDIEVDLGDSAIVQAMINLPVDEIDTVTWNPAGIIECLDANCLTIVVHPVNSIVLNATVTDINGCESTDQLNIVVDKNRNVYIPSVFSPNGDGQNDRFFIYGDEDLITNVTQFTIFNRWGGVVYEASNFQPNDPNSGWDGNEEDKGVNPGVFAYVVEIEFIDGIVLRYVGDVTVVR